MAMYRVGCGHVPSWVWPCTELGVASSTCTEMDIFCTELDCTELDLYRVGRNSLISGCLVTTLNVIQAFTQTLRVSLCQPLSLAVHLHVNGNIFHYKFFNFYSSQLNLFQNLKKTFKNDFDEVLRELFRKISLEMKLR